MAWWCAWHQTHASTHPTTPEACSSRFRLHQEALTGCLSTAAGSRGSLGHGQVCRTTPLWPPCPQPHLPLCTACVLTSPSPHHPHPPVSQCQCQQQVGVQLQQQCLKGLLLKAGAADAHNAAAKQHSTAQHDVAAQQTLTNQLETAAPRLCSVTGSLGVGAFRGSRSPPPCAHT